MKATYLRAVPYAGDALALPVKDVVSALPFYQTVMGFRVVSHVGGPVRSAILGRDAVQIGIAENGGDPTQEGCFFEVDSIATALAELKANGLQTEGEFRIDRHGGKSYKVFFVIAPDGLCYCLGEQQTGAPGTEEAK